MPENFKSRDYLKQKRAESGDFTMDGFRELDQLINKGETDKAINLINKTPSLIYGQAYVTEQLPIHTAIIEGDKKVIKHILSLDKNILLAEGVGNLFNYAIRYGEEDIAQDFLNIHPDFAAIPSFNYCNESVLHSAAQHGMTELTKVIAEKQPELLMHKSDRECTPLDLAVANNQINTIKFLIAREPKLLSEKNSVGWNVLDHLDTLSKNEKCLETAALLLDHKPSLLLDQNVIGISPLMKASVMGKTKLVELYLARDKKHVTLADDEGRQAIDYVGLGDWKVEEKDKETITKLLENAANPHKNLKTAAIGIIAGAATLLFSGVNKLGVVLAGIVGAGAAFGLPKLIEYFNQPTLAKLDAKSASNASEKSDQQAKLKDVDLNQDHVITARERKDAAGKDAEKLEAALKKSYGRTDIADDIYIPKDVSLEDVFSFSPENSPIAKTQIETKR